MSLRLAQRAKSSGASDSSIMSSSTIPCWMVWRALSRLSCVAVSIVSAADCTFAFSVRTTDLSFGSAWRHAGTSTSCPRESSISLISVTVVGAPSGSSGGLYCMVEQLLLISTVANLSASGMATPVGASCRASLYRCRALLSPSSFSLDTTLTNAGKSMSPGTPSRPDSASIIDWSRRLSLSSSSRNILRPISRISCRGSIWPSLPEAASNRRIWISLATSAGVRYHRSWSTLASASAVEFLEYSSIITCVSSLSVTTKHDSTAWTATLTWMLGLRHRLMSPGRLSSERPRASWMAVSSRRKNASAVSVSLLRGSSPSTARKSLRWPTSEPLAAMSSEWISPCRLISEKNRCPNLKRKKLYRCSCSLSLGCELV
mmetsp:Transcript_9601/g.27497  ORF Transcript_9601/g.27497 Transcript_9601/m.27497 type:complete len:374 (+) Transcript_9601:336-1457(+)